MFLAGRRTLNMPDAAPTDPDASRPAPCAGSFALAPLRDCRIQKGAAIAPFNRNQQTAGRCPADGQVNAGQGQRTHGGGMTTASTSKTFRGSTVRDGRAARPSIRADQRQPCLSVGPRPGRASAGGIRQSRQGRPVAGLRTPGSDVSDGGFGCRCSCPRSGGCAVGAPGSVQIPAGVPRSRAVGSVPDQ